MESSKHDAHVDWLDAVNNPEDTAAGMRKVPFSRVLYIERDDFMEDPPKKFFRLAPGREVRLRYAYFITCNDVIKNHAGEIVELRCTYDPATRGGDSPDGRKVKATLHWVSAEHTLDAEVRLYDHLFAKPFPEESGEVPASDASANTSGGGTPSPSKGEGWGEGGVAAGVPAGQGRTGHAHNAKESPPANASPSKGEGRGEGDTRSGRTPVARTAPDWKSNLNRDSLQIVLARIEPSVAGAAPGTRYQFERLGYFCVDSDSGVAGLIGPAKAEPQSSARGGTAAQASAHRSTPRLVFNRTVSLKDTWAKVAKH